MPSMLRVWHYESQSNVTPRPWMFYCPYYAKFLGNEVFRGSYSEFIDLCNAYE